MKKLIVISVLLCLAFAPISATAFAQSPDSVEINPLYVDEITVSTDQELILRVGWGACTRGLVQAYITAAHYEWTLDGAPIFLDEETAQYFGPIEPMGPSDTCVAGNGTLWASFWRYPMGTLDAGTHEISVHQWLDHPVIDGGDYDGDGRLDRFTDQAWDGTVTVHVVVEP